MTLTFFAVLTLYMVIDCQSSSWSSLFRWVGPNKFYGNISFIGRQAALFGNKGLWGRRRRGQSFTIYTLLCPAMLFSSVCFQYTLIRCTARGHNGSHNGSQCSMFIGHTHTLQGSQWVWQWCRARGGVGWFWTNALFQVVRRPPPLLSFCPPLLFSMSTLLLQLFVFCSCCRETPADFCHPSYRCARILWDVFR